MAERIDSKRFYGLQPALPQALLSLGEAAMSVLETQLVHLVKIRVSQLNHCGFCQHMHTAEARKDGELQERLDVLPAWRELDCFSERERAALNWAEKVTLLNQSVPSETDYAMLASQFSEKEIANLLAVIIAINGWNRIATGLNLQPNFSSLIR